MTTKDLIEKLNEIIELKEKGWTLKQIAEKYNSSASSIGRLLRSNNKWSRPKITNNDIDEMIRLYKEGKTLATISKSYHISSSTLSSIFKEKGIHINTSSETNRVYTLNENYFDIIDTPDKAYFLGLLYADGNCCESKGSISISLQSGDKHILDALNDALSSNRPLKKIEYSKKNINWQDQYLLRINSVHMTQVLIRYGLLPNKSLILTFPEWLNEELIPHFIRGYFDGDGCIPKNPKERRATLIGTMNFCSVVKDILLNQLGIHASISSCHKNSTTTRELRVSGKKQVKKFLDYIYSNSTIHLVRKYNLYNTLYCS